MSTEKTWKGSVGPPVYRRLKGVGEGVARGFVEDLSRVAVDLEVATLGDTVRPAVDDRDSWTAPHVERLARVGHHAQHQLAVEEVDLARADARPAVAAQGSKDAQVLILERLTTKCRQLGHGVIEVLPSHRPGESRVGGRSRAILGFRPAHRLCRGTLGRGVAQPGSAQRSGRWGRRFKSGRPDHSLRLCWPRSPRLRTSGDRDLPADPR